MTDCAELLALVEKLSDFEATAAETLAAKAHLEKCPSCRTHFEFLTSLTEESRSMAFPEPPESYWEHLPQKVLDRIDSEGRRPSGFWSILLAPSMLRWGALGATLLLVAALGVSVLREDSRTPEPPAPRAPVAEAPKEEARVAAEPMVSPPPMARDEAVPAASQLESLPGAEEERGRESPKSLEPAPAAPAETVEAFESNEGVAPSLQPASKENVQVLESASRARVTAAPAAARSRVVLEDCDALRRTVASSVTVSDGDGSDARFRLALCSLESHEREATDELRKRALEDAEAFLAGESEGTRAEEIREKLRRIKPD
ncbi:MAG: hypothetical protein ACRD1Z_10055 [Vicinamibacteria bacterium]